MLFCELRPRVDNALGDVNSGKDRYAAAKAALTQAKNALDGMGAVYSAVAAAVEAGATANPSNPAWLALRAEKDLALAERATVHADVDCLLAAFTKVTSHGAAAVLGKLNELV